MLDEELKLPQKGDAQWLGKVCQRHGSHERFKRPVKVAGAFSVLHYAGEVTYRVEGFLDKNKDQMYEELVRCLSKAADPFIAALMAPLAQEETRRTTLSTQFRAQLSALMGTINATSPHYVRCIKPNEKKQPASTCFDAPMTLRQLTYAGTAPPLPSGPPHPSGVFEAVAIRRQGFPFRLTHERFFKRFRCLAPQLQGAQWAQLSRQILGSVPGAAEAQIGTSMVLYKAPVQRLLDLQRNLAVRKLVLRAQALYRRWYAQQMVRLGLQMRADLQKAVTARQQAPLEALVARAAALPYEFRELKEARALLKYMQEEKVTSLAHSLPLPPPSPSPPLPSLPLPITLTPASGAHFPRSATKVRGGVCSLSLPGGRAEEGRG